MISDDLVRKMVDAYDAHSGGHEPSMRAAAEVLAEAMKMPAIPVKLYSSAWSGGREIQLDFNRVEDRIAVEAWLRSQMPEPKREAEAAQKSSGRVPDQECFWLIERLVSPPQYLRSSYGGLTDDSWAAERFENERHAIDHWRKMTDRSQYKVVEHMFLNHDPKDGEVPTREAEPSLNELLKRARAKVDAMSREKLEAMLKAQGEGYAKAEASWGDEGTRAFPDSKADPAQPELPTDFDEAMVGERNVQSSTLESMIEYMVRRFLGWKLPKDFDPDGGISFKANFNEGMPWSIKHEPTGTNLLSATQAKAMIRYMLDGWSPDLAQPQAPVRRHVERGPERRMGWEYVRGIEYKILERDSGMCGINRRFGERRKGER